MIAFLRGKVFHNDGNMLIIDVNDVGYEVFTPTAVANDLLKEETVELHICSVVREDAFTLYGFSTKHQKQAFNTLRGVNKIGAKLALGILSHFDVHTLTQAVESGDSRTLSSIPGIGKKTAERMCLELKGKLNPDNNIAISSTAPIVKREDPLQLALAQLDYRKSEIDSAINSQEVPNIGDSALEDRLRAALHFLAKQP